MKSLNTKEGTIPRGITTQGVASIGICKRGTNLKTPRILSWDIEATHLRADFGYILCIGYKFLHWKKPRIIKIESSPKYKRDVTNDLYVCEEFKKIHDTADMTLTWYGGRFDYPYVNSRLLLDRRDKLRDVPHIDLWRTAKYQMNLTSNRLDNVARYMKLKDEKTSVRGRTWVKAMSGHRPSLKYIYDHCYADVLVLEEAYLAMRHIVKQHPNLALLGDTSIRRCPSCTAIALTLAGKRVTRTSVQQRWRCTSCGSYSQSPYKKTIGIPR